MLEENNEVKKSAFKAFYLFFVINIMIIGYATTELITFSIEEAFEQPVVYGIFNIWGPEFAKSAAWLIISSFVILPLAIVQKKISLNHPELYTLKFRHRLINIAIFIGLVTSFFYILMTTYSYFSGRSDPVGMYRVGLTIIMIAMGLIVLWFEKSISHKLKLPIYLAIFIIPVVGCVTMGTMLTLQYAPPSKMRKVNEDLNKIEAIESLAIIIKNHFIINGMLPRDKNIVIQEGKNPLLHEFYDVINYEVIDHAKFKLCTNFETNYSDARRMTRAKNRFYKEGAHCLIFSLAKQKEKTTINVLNNTNLKVILPYYESDPFD